METVLAPDARTSTPSPMTAEKPRRDRLAVTCLVMAEKSKRLSPSRSVMAVSPALSSKA